MEPTVRMAPSSHLAAISLHAVAAIRTPQVVAPVATQDTTFLLATATTVHRIATLAHRLTAMTAPQVTDLRATTTPANTSPPAVQFPPSWLSWPYSAFV